MEFNCIPTGDRAILVQFEQEISEEINRKVIMLAQYLTKSVIKGIEEWVPAYASLMIYYDPFIISYDELVNIISNFDLNVASVEETSSRIQNIPVLYGGDLGPDLIDVAKYNGLTPDEVIQLHSAPLYHVYMIGFSPGFPYLGGLNTRLHTPRLETPRIRVREGSVGIAGGQTGIYTLPTPGGWKLIGHTPIPLFQPENVERPTLISAGDKIKFVPITIEEYEAIKRKNTTNSGGNVNGE